MVKRNIQLEDLTKEQLCKMAKALVQDNFDVRWEMKELKAEFAKSPWIPITPETMPEEDIKWIVAINKHLKIPMAFRVAEIVNWDELTHYQPITLPEEK